MNFVHFQAKSGLGPQKIAPKCEKLHLSVKNWTWVWKIDLREAKIDQFEVKIDLGQGQNLGQGSKSTLARVKIWLRGQKSTLAGAKIWPGVKFWDGAKIGLGQVKKSTLGGSKLTNLRSTNRPREGQKIDLGKIFSYDENSILKCKIFLLKIEIFMFWKLKFYDWKLIRVKLKLIANLILIVKL